MPDHHTFKLLVLRTGGGMLSSFPSTSGTLCANRSPSGSSFLVGRHFPSDTACTLCDSCVSSGFAKCVSNGSVTSSKSDKHSSQKKKKERKETLLTVFLFIIRLASACIFCPFVLFFGRFLSLQHVDLLGLLGLFRDYFSFIIVLCFVVLVTQLPLLASRT